MNDRLPGKGRELPAGRRRRSAPETRDPFSLTGQTALVTGARSGIGAAVAVGLARAGANLVLLGRRDDLDDTAQAARGCGSVVETSAVDLSRPSQTETAVRELLARRRVDVLVNNAGVIERGPAEEVDFASWRAVHAVNLDAAFLLARECGAEMIKRGSGKIVNIASLLSFQGGVDVAAYASSKHALAGMTKALANEWARHGVQVNAVAPGYIATDNTAPLRADALREASIRKRIPAGRWGSPEDVVGATVFLASSAADYVNGHVLVVDGGWMAR
ncbi:MAG: SDR family oxidoreductase [Stackebrandtia sp.]